MHSGERLWVQFSPLNYSTTFCSCLFVSLIQMVENVITFPVVHVSAGGLNKKLWITRTPAAPLCDIYAAAVFFFVPCAATCACGGWCIIHTWHSDVPLKRPYSEAPCSFFRPWIQLKMQENTNCRADPGDHQHSLFHTSAVRTMLSGRVERAETDLQRCI